MADANERDSSPEPPRGSASISGDQRMQSQVLESLTQAVNYNAWLRDLAQPYLGEHPIELGSGLGDFAQAWLDGGVPRITVTEPHEPRFLHLRERFAGDPRVAVRRLDVPAEAEVGVNGGDRPLRHSSLVAINVLEHIADDVSALRAAHRLVRPGGTVIIFAPAFPFAMSRFDRQVGHARRYTRTTIAAAYQQAGLTINRLHYVNALGLPAWVVGMRLLRRVPHDGPLLRWWDRGVIPIARGVENRLRPPFGQSVFAVGRVPTR